MKNTENIKSALTLIGIIGIIICGLMVAFAIMTNNHWSDTTFFLWGIGMIISFTCSMSSLLGEF